MQSKVNELNLQAPLFKDLLEKVDRNMDLPKVSRHYRLGRSLSSGRIDLMNLQNGDPFLSSYNGTGGSFYLSTVPLDAEWSNLTRHAFFVAIVLRAAELSDPSGKIYYTIGSDAAIEVDLSDNGAATVLHIVDEGTLDMIPELRQAGDRTELFVHDQILIAGNYDLMQENAQSGALSFNYDRSGSALQPISTEALQAAIDRSEAKNISILELENKTITAGLLQELDEGKHLWRWFILLALIFLGLETALIRFWK